MYLSIFIRRIRRIAHETREWTRKEERSQDLQRVKAALCSFSISASEFFASFRVFRGLNH
jgi:hypothetical protein